MRKKKRRWKEKEREKESEIEGGERSFIAPTNKRACATTASRTGRKKRPRESNESTFYRVLGGSVLPAQERTLQVNKFRSFPPGRRHHRARPGPSPSLLLSRRVAKRERFHVLPPSNDGDSFTKSCVHKTANPRINKKKKKRAPRSSRVNQATSYDLRSSQR